MHKDPVRLPPELRPRVGSALLEKLHAWEIPVLAISVSGDHVHLQGRFPHPKVRAIVGYAKAHASHSIRDSIAGVVFAKKCKVKPIRDRDHQRRTYTYITDHRDEGAWVWTFRECHPFEW
jgi:REP element-mobilizing transposase RayT